MGYQESLEAAGAVVHEMVGFTDYQGTWFALVTYKNETGWVEGSYGSCSGWDSFEAEFGWSYNEEPDIDERLRLFGESYLTHLATDEEMLERYVREDDEYYSWDADAKDMIDYIRAKCAREEAAADPSSTHEFFPN